jgi:hypothetical protein
LDQHEAERERLRGQEIELVENEKRLGYRLGEYQRRLRTVEIAELDDEIKARKEELDEEIRGRKAELDQVLKQLGEKKTLLTRMFGKQREGDSQ